MTSFESNDSNTVEADGICMEIWEPDLIVLPITENRLDVDIPVQINVVITNNTPTPFPFIYGILSPELVREDGLALQPQKLIDRQIPTSQYYGISIPPKRSLVCSLIAKLCWQNNLLQLQGTISNHTQVLANREKSYFFEPLQLGNYRLRFTYLSPNGEFLFFDSHTGDINRVESFVSEPLTTAFVHLRLVEPVGSYKNAVEVDGIRFETVIPERKLTVPLIGLNIQIPVQIGMQITNKTSTPFRFSSFDTLIPELMGADGLVLRQSAGGVLGWANPRESDFHLVMPGENITLLPNVSLVWLADGLFKLIFPGGGRANWSFNNLKLGTYRIQLRYRSLTAESDVLFEDLWMVMVSTPFVDFCLFQS